MPHFDNQTKITYPIVIMIPSQQPIDDKFKKPIPNKPKPFVKYDVAVNNAQPSSLRAGDQTVIQEQIVTKPTSLDEREMTTQESIFTDKNILTHLLRFMDLPTLKKTVSALNPDMVSTFTAAAKTPTEANPVSWEEKQAFLEGHVPITKDNVAYFISVKIPFSELSKLTFSPSAFDELVETYPEFSNNKGPLNITLKNDQDLASLKALIADKKITLAQLAKCSCEKYTDEMASFFEDNQRVLIGLKTLSIGKLDLKERERIYLIPSRVENFVIQDYSQIKSLYLDNIKNLTIGKLPSNARLPYCPKLAQLTINEIEINKKSSTLKLSKLQWGGQQSRVKPLRDIHIGNIKMSDKFIGDPAEAGFSLSIENFKILQSIHIENFSLPFKPSFTLSGMSNLETLRINNENKAFPINYSISRLGRIDKVNVPRYDAAYFSNFLVRWGWDVIDFWRSYWTRG